MDELQLDELQLLAQQYINNKKQQDYFKELCDEQNRQIKKIMREKKLDSTNVGNTKISYIISRKETINEAKFIDVLKCNNIHDVIKQKEYIDMDALEKAIYNGKLSEDILLQLNEYTSYKNIETLRTSTIS